MTEALVILAIFAGPVVGVAVVVCILLLSVLQFARANGFYIVLKALAALVVWAAASFGWFYMFLAVAYTSVSLLNIEGETGKLVSILPIDVIYAAIGCGLVFWIRGKHQLDMQGVSE